MSTPNDSHDRLLEQEANEEAQLVKLLRDSTLISRTENSTQLLSPVFQEELYRQIQIQTRNLQMNERAQEEDPMQSSKLIERLARLFKLLREGLVASRRNDAWTVKVYSAAVRFYLCHAKYGEGQTCCLGLLQQPAIDACSKDYHVTLLLLSSLRATEQSRATAFSELYYRYPLQTPAFILSVYDAVLNRNYVLLSKLLESAKDDATRCLLQCLLKECYKQTLASHLTTCYHSLSLERLAELFELLQLDVKGCMTFDQDKTRVSLSLGDPLSFPIQSARVVLK